MLLAVPLPDASFPAPRIRIRKTAEDVDAVGTDAGLLVEHGAPEAEDGVVLVEEDLPVQAPELRFGVDVEEEEAAGIQIFPDAAEGLLQLLRLGHIVHAVQTADAKIHRIRQTQTLHALADEIRRVSHVSRFPAGLGQHFLRPVRAEDGEAAASQQNRHGAGPAGQVQGGFRAQPVPGEDLIVEAQDLLIGNIVGQAVIGRRKGFIGHGSLLFVFRRIFFPHNRGGTEWEKRIHRPPVSSGRWTLGKRINEAW